MENVLMFVKCVSNVPVESLTYEPSDRFVLKHPDCTLKRHIFFGF